jgi:hypothetical protein
MVNEILLTSRLLLSVTRFAHIHKISIYRKRYVKEHQFLHLKYTVLRSSNFSSLTIPESQALICTGRWSASSKNRKSASPRFHISFLTSAASSN